MTAPVHVIVKIDQRSPNVCVYHTQFLLARGESEAFESVADLEQAMELPELGRAIAEQLLGLEGMEEVMLFNYQIWVRKTPECLWGGPGGLNLRVLHQLAEAIALALETTKIVARLRGAAPRDIGGTGSIAA